MSIPDAIKAGETVVSLPLSQLHVDRAWNLRSGKWQDDEDPTDGNGFGALVASIRTSGQDTPVIARANTNEATKAAKPYALIVGFRREAAIRLIAKEKGEADPTIKVIVRKLDDIEARSLNLRENGPRSEIKPADMAWAINDLLRLQPTLLDKQIAAEIGRSAPYVSHLHRIMSGLDPKVAKAWREASVQVPVTSMLGLAEQCPKDRQMEEFAKMAAPPDPNGPPTRGPNAWKETFRKAFEEIGSLLGYLEANDILTLNKNVLDTADDWLGLCKKIPAKAESRDKQSFAKALARGHEKGVKRLADEEAAKAEEAEAAKVAAKEAEKAAAAQAKEDAAKAKEAAEKAKAKADKEAAAAAKAKAGK